MRYAGIGSRETPIEALEVCRALGKKLASLGWTLSTGGAKGADDTFLQGTILGKGHAELYLPAPGFNGHTGGTLLVPSPEATEIAQANHPNWQTVGPFGKLLLSRNSHIILGSNLDDPVSFVICWTKQGKGHGGTGQALRVARSYNVPVFDLALPEVVERLHQFLEATPTSSIETGQ